MRAVVGEDQLLFRQGLVRLLAESEFDVVAEAADADDLVRKACAHKPEVVVSDVGMPPGHADDGLRAAITIRQRVPEVRVVVLSQYVALEPAGELLSGDAAGVDICSRTA